MHNVDDHRRGRHIWFYRIGIGDHDGDMDNNGWKIGTLSSLVEQFNDTGVSTGRLTGSLLRPCVCLCVCVCVSGRLSVGALLFEPFDL